MISTNKQTLLDQVAWTSRIYLEGWIQGSGGDYSVTEPATGEELGRLGQAAPQDVRTAAKSAVAAQRDWARRPYDERAAVLRRAGDLWTAHSEELADWIVRESGSVRPKAHGEIAAAAAECYEAAALASAPYGEMIQTHRPRMSFTRRVPVGVVGVISPFNFPLVLSMRALAPALALGNAVIVKPDPRTAVCGGVSIAAIFAEAGLPPGVLSVLPGGSDVGEALVADPDVPVIAFTGSTRAGRAVAIVAAGHLKRTHLELGGNSAMIVLDDADVETAAELGSFGSFFHSGQICMATSRHLVHDSIAAEYVARLSARADELVVANPATEPADLGPIIDESQLNLIDEIVTSSISDGARLTAGGSYQGLFYRPTVLADVPEHAAASRQEIFGPVAPVLTFSTLAEAARIAADTSYGLSLGIVSPDVMKALDLADQIPSGLVHINDQTVNDEAVAPFGGVRNSGTGSRHGGTQANLEAFTEVQWTTIRRQPIANRG